MNSIPFPRTYDKNLYYESVEIIHPIQVSIDLNITPLSTATIVMPRDKPLNRSGYIELFTASGSAGFFRIRSPEIVYENDTITYELEHAVAEVGDWLVKTKQEGSMNAKTALRRIWRGTDSTSTSDDNYRGDKWQLGDMTSIGDITVELSVDHEDVLSAMLDVMDALPGIYMQFDFTTSPWTINFVSRENPVVQDYAYGRLSRNVSSATVTYDDTDLCTRVYYEYGDTWRTYTSPAEITDLYGIVERTVSTSGESSLARAQYVAKEFLRKNREPKIAIQISGQELSAITGVSEDKLEIGKLFKLYVPELETDAARNITALSWANVYDDPLGVEVTLGDEDPTLWGYIRYLNKKK